MSPKYAKFFLKHYDLEITNYHSELGDGWKGSSKIKLNEDFMTGNCIYEISGTKYVVNEMKLHLVVFDSSRKQDVHEFLKIANLLSICSLYIDLPNKIRKAIFNLHNVEHDDDLGRVSVRVSRWKNEKRGYDLYLNIKREEHEIHFKASKRLVKHPARVSLI